jgi:hypothetical protein
MYAADDQTDGGATALRAHRRYHEMPVVAHLRLCVTVVVHDVASGRRGQESLSRERRLAGASATAKQGASWLPAMAQPSADAPAKPAGDDEGPLAAGVVGDPATQQEQTTERQGVGRDDPLPVCVADAEVLPEPTAGRC